MRFGVFTDLHYDVVPDADRRISEIITKFKNEKVDFAVDLGDLCHPTIENKKILERFEQAAIPCFFSIGNHNTDFCAPEVVLRFFGLSNGYYSMLQENIKFIFLDANYIKTRDGFLPECEANFQYNSNECPYIPPEQIKWLRNELSDDRYFYIICSHQSLSNDLVIGRHSRGIVNREEVRAVLEERNSKGKRILFCMNGNDHGDAFKNINNIYYYTLNSASYIWHGLKETYNYSKEVHNRYPHLKDIILYEEALCIIITIDKKMNVQIDGMKGHYQNITPEQVGMGDTWNAVSIKPQTSSLYIAL